MPLIMLNQILSTCKQLNRLLAKKDPYHSDMVSKLLANIENRMPSDSPEGLDRYVIIKALKDEADR